METNVKTLTIGVSIRTGPYQGLLSTGMLSPGFPDRLRGQWCLRGHQYPGLPWAHRPPKMNSPCPLFGESSLSKCTFWLMRQDWQDSTGSQTHRWKWIWGGDDANLGGVTISGSKQQTPKLKITITFLKSILMINTLMILIFRTFGFVTRIFGSVTCHCL